MELSPLIQCMKNCADTCDCPDDCPMKTSLWKRMGYAACKPFKEMATYVPVQLLREAIAALEATLPRLMTLKELSKGYEGPVWVEWRPPYDYDSHWVIRDFPPGFNPDNGGLFVKYRYWTAPPSKEQTAAIPWEDDKK